MASNHKDLDRLIESLPGAVGEATFFDLKGCLLSNFCLSVCLSVCHIIITT